LSSNAERIAMRRNLRYAIGSEWPNFVVVASVDWGMSIIHLQIQLSYVRLEKILLWTCHDVEGSR